MHVPVFAQAVVNEIHDAGWDCETESFAAAALRENEGIDADYRSIHIDQRPAAVAGIDGGIGLDVGDGFFGIGLAGDGADNSQGDRILQPFGLPMAKTSCPTRARGCTSKGRVGRSFSSILSNARSV